MTSRFGQAEDRHSLVRRNFETGDQLMDTRRLCGICHTKQPQLGSMRLNNGTLFVCRICKGKIRK